MKNQLAILLFIKLLLFVSIANANTYYVSTSGNDSNPGTIGSPFATWQKGFSVLTAGDILYIRGGTYQTPNISTDYRVHMNNINGNSGSHIQILAYPGEKPVLDFTNITQTTNSTGFRIDNCSWIDFKGLRITGLVQQSNANLIAGWAYWTSHDMTFEFCEVDHIGGPGFMGQTGTNNLTFINCDSHHNGDQYKIGDPYGDADGFDVTEGIATYIGCRAWWNSDDGFDCFPNDSYVTYKNCWSFWNGYIPGTFNHAGNGNGFKWGITNSDQRTTIKRRYEFCLAFKNYTSAWDQNVARCGAEFYNCTSYQNPAMFTTGWGLSPVAKLIMRNCLSYVDGGIVTDPSAPGDHNYNTWDLSLTTTDADFQSVNSNGIDGPRQSDGSLPAINFLHPVSNSKLINAGVNVGLSFTGSAPDLGYFQYSATSPVNQPPVANAGSAQIVILPISLAVLTGNGTDPDGTIASYQWTKIAGPASAIMLTPNLAVTTVTTLVQGVYQFELKVTDNQGAIGKDTVTVSVNSAPNQLPAANAGADKTITLPINNVTLAGNGTDPDGTIAIYQWNKISGPSQFTIASPNQAQTLISGLVQGTYQFELRVTDNLGGIGKDTVKVTVNAAANQLPTAIAGTDKIITLPTNNTTLTGSAVDADGTITSYQWSKVSGPTQFTISSSSQSQTAITNLVQGLYQFELKVTDNLGAIGKDTVLVTVNIAANQSPIANAGANINITLPTSSATLTGTGTDPDGTIATYRWTKIAGPLQFSIASRNSAQTSVNSLTQGTYQFELQVTDNSGATATDTFLAVTVNAAPPSPNQPPIANTGADKTITLPTNTVTATGNGTDADGTIASYQWSKISGPSQFAIASPTQAQTAINNLVQGIYLFELTVTDNLGALGKDTMIVTVNIAPPPVTNQSPIANAGTDISITLPTNSATLTGSGTDQDGLIASYRWTKIAGPNQFTITSRSQAQSSITNLKQGIYQFELQVTDNQNATGKDTVIVTVNAAPATNKKPSASAGSDKKITLPTNSTTLTGSGNDSDGTITSYQWNKVSGPSQPAIASPDQTQTQITNLAQGVYSFELRVTDDQGAVAADTIMITVIAPPNQLPAANAGNDITITLPTNGAGLSGNGTDPDGTIVTYRWTKIAGPNLFIITSRNETQTTVNNLTQGVYQFELQVTDNAGAIAKDTVTITVLAAPNQPPVANAGFDNNLTLPANSVILTGSGIDADGTIVSYQWNKVSGPAQFTIVSPTQAQTTINNLVQGVYSFELTVTDNQGATAKDIVTISVNPAPPVSNQSPVANAGTDKTITLPANSVILTGNGTDADGTIASYQWNKVSGPAQFTIASPNQGQTLISGLVQGIYQFELTVTDNKGATGKATVTITVNPASGTSSNQPPVANAGTDKSITLPSNSVTLSGGGTDPDGTIASYQWSKVSGPAQFTIISPSQAQTLITGLVQGTYQFQLTVTDNKGATGKATVTIMVNPEAGASSNQSPVVNAGSDIRIILPTDSATLTGSATDPDGTIIAYQWAKVSGPATYTITSADKPQASVSNLVEGTYQFELKVTDNKGAVGKDIVSVVVLNQGSKISTISAYPNPATTTLNVRLEAVANPDLITMNIYDARGMIIRQEQFMRSQQAMTRQIDISRYTNGMYVLELGNDLNREMLKFVKQ